jgi:hypothetical protein
MVICTEVNKVVVEQVTHLGEEFSRYIEEEQEEFLTKGEFYDSLTALENDMMSVQGRYSEREFREICTLLSRNQQQSQHLTLGPHHHLQPLL